MRFLKYGLILSATSFFVFACSQSPTTGNSNKVTQNVNETAVSTNTTSTNSSANNQSADPELASARKIYAEKCVVCHKETGEGGKVNLEGAEFNVPNYKTDRAKNKSDEKLLDYIENGDDEMPSFKGKITTEEMKSLVKLIRRDFQGK